MLSSIHFLLTYQCNIGCDHCFLYCGPRAPGVFTAVDLERALDQICQVASISAVCYEGGEPTLYFPLLLEGLRLAQQRHLETSIVTNAYWATSVHDAELWISPMLALGLSGISVSDDTFHFGPSMETAARHALAAAQALGLPASAICIAPPTVTAGMEGDRGEPIVGGGVRFRGRAAQMVDGLPRQHWERYATCPYEKLEDPSRIHLDPYGNLHLCQGLLMGNIWQTPLAEIMARYDPQAHPIVGPLLRGGPAALATAYGLSCEKGYVDACHLCYMARLQLLARFPDYLGPPQVYGLT